MERDVRYLTVGLVVALLLGGFLAFAAWQAGTYQASDRDRYTIHVEGGVSGLNKGSGVRYRGVEVGRVLGVRMDPQQPKSIRVDIAVQPATPVTEGTEARIKPKGITGLSYIELATEAPGPPPPKPEGEPYPVIQARPSRLDRVLEDLPEVATQVTRIADRVERLVSDDNVTRLQQTLDNARQLSERLNRVAARAEGTLAEVDRAAAEARATFEGGREMVPRVRAMLPEVEATLANMRSLSARLDRLARRNEGHVDRFAGEGLEELRLFLRDGRATMAEIKALARDLRANPTQLVIPPKGGGMEIPR